MIIHYLKIAWRNLLKYRTQSVISIIGLAIGFTAFILAGYWYHWEHSFDTFHSHSKRTYAVTTSGILEARGARHADLNQLHEEAKNYIVTLPEVEVHCMTDVVSYMNEGNERAWNGMKVDSSFFQLFECDLLEGSYHGNAYDDNSVILTRSMARHLFGDEPCVGKLFETMSKDFTIVGVMQDYPGYTHFKFEYLQLGSPQYRGNVKRLPTYIRLKENVNEQSIRDKIASYRLSQEDNRLNTYSEWRFNLCPLSDIHITCSPHLDTRFRNIEILAVAGLLMFISALMNLLVLFISRQHVKLRYNSLYKTMGESTRGLVGKGLIELLLSLLIAFIVLMAILELIYPVYGDYTRLDHYGIFEDFVQYMSKDRLILSSVSSFWISGALFLLINIVPLAVMINKESNRGTTSFSSLLITGQVFIGSLFLIGALSFYSQYQFTRSKDKGIVTENIWQIDLGYESVYEKDADPYIQLLKNSPYISDVTVLTAPIFSTLRQYYCSYIIQLPLQGEGDDQAEANVVMVEPNFLTFFGMQMKSGEWLSQSGVSEYVINETGAQMIQLGEDFNKVYETPDSHGNKFRISGVLKDYHYFPVQYPLEKTFFHSPPESVRTGWVLKTPYIYIKVSSENEERALAFAKQHYADFSKDKVASEKQFQYLPDIMKELNIADIHMSRIFLALAITCILISSLGIYLLVALSTEQRKKEIAIRLINGASYPDILKLFLRRYLVLTLIANMVSLPLGYLFVNQWLQTYAYHFALSFLMFAFVLLITLAIVALSVAIQVSRVLKMNPADVVKSE